MFLLVAGILSSKIADQLNSAMKSDLFASIIPQSDIHRKKLRGLTKPEPITDFTALSDQIRDSLIWIKESSEHANSNSPEITKVFVQVSCKYVADTRKKYYKLISLMLLPSTEFLSVEFPRLLSIQAIGDFILNKTCLLQAMKEDVDSIIEVTDFLKDHVDTLILDKLDPTIKSRVYE
jgi:hypothetical protein